MTAAYVVAAIALVALTRWITGRIDRGQASVQPPTSAAG